MARKKDKTGTDNTSTRCSWSAADDAIVVRVLREQKDAGNQSGSGWKKTVWNLVAETLEKEGISNGPPKTATKCSDHYSNVSDFFFPSFVTTLMILKLAKSKLSRCKGDPWRIGVWVG